MKREEEGRRRWKKLQESRDWKIMEESSRDWKRWENGTSGRGRTIKREE